MELIREAPPTQEQGKVYKDGVELLKGFTLSERWLLEHEDIVKQYSQFFSAYPDLFIDLITPSDSNFQLYFYQRIFLRACMRYRYHYCTAPRAFSKTFLSILALFLKCIFQPRSKVFICAPGKNQSAKIAKEKIIEIYQLFPILRKEVIGGDISDTPGNFGTDYITIKFRNQSVFDVVGALDSTRGGRRSGGLIDEVRDHDGSLLNEVVLPLMNVDRRTLRGEINPFEKQQTQFYMTSAGTKATFAYEKQVELFENEILDPSNTFVWGCDYRVPLLHNLLNKTYIKEIKTSATFKEDSFARELTA